MIVGHKEINKGDIFGTYKKYTYISHSKNCPEGVKCYVYCTSDSAFEKLLFFWSKQAKSSFYKDIQYNYTLSLNGYVGKDIALEDIPADQNYKLKMSLHCSNIGVQYIQ